MKLDPKNIHDVDFMRYLLRLIFYTEKISKEINNLPKDYLFYPIIGYIRSSAENARQLSRLLQLEKSETLKQLRETGKNSIYTFLPDETITEIINEIQ